MMRIVPPLVMMFVGFYLGLKGITPLRPMFYAIMIPILIVVEVICFWLIPTYIGIPW